MDQRPPRLTRTDLQDIYDARLERVGSRLQNLDLSDRYLDALRTNRSRVLSYHGNPHLLAVACLVGSGAQALALPNDERRALTIAALLHDYGYDPSIRERQNIEASMDFARELTGELNPELTERVVTLIEATEFPHWKAQDSSEALIQDADLLMISQPDFDVFLQGLTEEQPGLKPDPRFPGVDGLTTDWAKRVYATALELYSNGKRVEDPRAATFVGATLHPQSLSSRGFLVDSTMLEGLEALWAAGFETSWSCGGDLGKASPGYDAPLKGYVSFEKTGWHQRRAIGKAAKAVGGTVELPPKGEGVRAVVARFPAKETKRFLSLVLNPDAQQDPAKAKKRLKGFRAAVRQRIRGGA